MSRVARFEVECHRVLGQDGRPVGDLPVAGSDRQALTASYRWMVLTRTFDAKAVSLQRTGRLGTYASSLGQEAVSVAVGMTMAPDDVFFPSFREQGAQLVRGVAMEELLTYWGGDERGSAFVGPVEDFPICVPVASHVPHAAGVALAFRLRHEPRVAVCVLGDGGTSKGDFYEAMNFAGVRRLPLVMVVNNNQWAISVPRDRQSAAETLAQKAIAAGIAGEQVDGNDIIALSWRMETALQRARTGDGPTLIEALTYRLSDHTTADDARRYRDDGEVSERWKLDPVARLRTFMSERGFWGKSDEERVLAECRADVETATESYLARSPRAPGTIFDHLYDALPESLAGQRAEAAEDLDGG